MSFWIKTDGVRSPCLVKMVPFVPLLSICFVGCDDVAYENVAHYEDALDDRSRNDAGNPGNPSKRDSLSPGEKMPAGSQTRVMDLAPPGLSNDDPDESEYVIVGPDDVDRFGWNFGFGVGERVPKATLQAQRALVDRMNELFEEWRQSGQDPQEFLRTHREELRSLNRVA